MCKPQNRGLKPLECQFSEGTLLLLRSEGLSPFWEGGREGGGG
jgi:hypothetical protein